MLAHRLRQVAQHRCGAHNFKEVQAELDSLRGGIIALPMRLVVRPCDVTAHRQSRIPRKVLRTTSHDGVHRIEYLAPFDAPLHARVKPLEKLRPEAVQDAVQQRYGDVQLHIGCHPHYAVSKAGEEALNGVRVVDDAVRVGMDEHDVSVHVTKLQLCVWLKLCILRDVEQPLGTHRRHRLPEQLPQSAQLRKERLRHRAAGRLFRPVRRHERHGSRLHADGQSRNV